MARTYAEKKVANMGQIEILVDPGRLIFLGAAASAMLALLAVLFCVERKNKKGKEKYVILQKGQRPFFITFKDRPRHLQARHFDTGT